RAENVPAVDDGLLPLATGTDAEGPGDRSSGVYVARHPNALHAVAPKFAAGFRRDTLENNPGLRPRLQCGCAVRSREAAAVRPGLVAFSSFPPRRAAHGKQSWSGLPPKV